MTTVGSFVAALSRRTLRGKAAAWDVVGLQLGDPAAAVARVAVCHEVTESVVEAVAADRPDLVVAYHPLLFHPTSRLVAGPTPAGRAWRLVSAGVALAITHTDFDAASGGTADALAEALELKTTSAFGPVVGSDQIKIVVFVPGEEAEAVASAMSLAGAGSIGNYTACSFRARGEATFTPGVGSEPVVGLRGQPTVTPEVRLEMVAARAIEDIVISALLSAHPYEEPAFDVYDVRSNHGLIGRVGGWDGTLADLASSVAERLGGTGLRVAGDPHVRVERVAVIPGSGGSFIGAAAAAGADAVVTGDVDHHRAVEAVDRGLGVVDPGHAATELPGMRRLVELVADLGVETVDLTGDGTGPWVDAIGNSLR